MAEHEHMYHHGHHNDHHDDEVLIAASADATRDLVSATTDAGRDLTNATSNGAQHANILGNVLREGGDGRAATFNASGQVRDSVHHSGHHVEGAVNHGNQHLTHEMNDGHRHLTDTVQAVGTANADATRDGVQNLGSMITHGFQNVTSDVHNTAQRLGDGQVMWGKNILENVLQNRYDLARDILSEGCKGREATLSTAAQIREDLADAKADLMKEHCATQRLVIEQHCETREAVREEGVRVRDVVIAEARAELDRDLAAASQENTLLKLRIDILSGGGPGPFSRTA